MTANHFLSGWRSTRPRPRSITQVLDSVRALAYASIGFAPITAAALSVFEFVPLHVGGPGLVSGAIAVGLWLQMLAPFVSRWVGRRQAGILFSAAPLASVASEAFVTGRSWHHEG